MARPFQSFIGKMTVSALGLMAAGCAQIPIAVNDIPEAPQLIFAKTLGGSDPGAAFDKPEAAPAQTALVETGAAVEPRVAPPADLPAIEPEPEPGPIAPIELSVVQAFFEESTLKIKIHLKAKTKLATSDLIAAVVGLRDGETVEEHFQVVGRQVGIAELQPEQTIALLFALRQPGLTEYQVKGSWGEDAKRLIAAHDPAVSETQSAAAVPVVQTPAADSGAAEPDPRARMDTEVETAAAPEPEIRIQRRGELEPNLTDEAEAERAPLTLENLDLERSPLPCEHPPCKEVYAINAVLVNHGRKPLRDLELAVGIYWVNEGEIPRVPEYLMPAKENEEVIALGDLELPPSGRQQVRIAVDREVPQVPGGRFIPHLRVLSFSPSN